MHLFSFSSHLMFYHSYFFIFKFQHQFFMAHLIGPLQVRLDLSLTYTGMPETPPPSEGTFKSVANRIRTQGENNTHI